MLLLLVLLVLMLLLVDLEIAAVVAGVSVDDVVAN